MEIVRFFIVCNIILLIIAILNLLALRASRKLRKSYKELKDSYLKTLSFIKKQYEISNDVKSKTNTKSK